MSQECSWCPSQTEIKKRIRQFCGRSKQICGKQLRLCKYLLPSPLSKMNNKMHFYCKLTHCRMKPLPPPPVLFLLACLALPLPCGLAPWALMQMAFPASQQALSKVLKPAGGLRCWASLKWERKVGAQMTGLLSTSSHVVHWFPPQPTSVVARGSGGGGGSVSVVLRVQKVLCNTHRPPREETLRKVLSIPLVLRKNGT